MQAENNGAASLKCWKSYWSRILHLVKMSFKGEGKINTSPARQQLREINDNRPAEMLKEILQAGGREYQTENQIHEKKSRAPEMLHRRLS